jgi:hypothetical protein
VTQIEKVLYTGKTIPKAAGTARPEARTAVWILRFRLLAAQAGAPIQSNCSLQAGPPVSSVQWGSRPEK